MEKEKKKNRDVISFEEEFQAITSWKNEKENKKNINILESKGSSKEEIPELRMLERAPSSAYITLDGLHTQTGCDSQDLDLFVLKELVDNALDACGSSPEVGVRFRSTSKGFFTLTVEDNGKGISEADLRKIADFDKLYSTKYHYKYLTRGALGNAFKCIIGLPYALATERGAKVPKPLISIHSLDRKHLINLQVNNIKEEVNSQILSSRHIKKQGTKVSVNLCPYQQDWGQKKEYYNLFFAYSIFNPNTTFSIDFGESDRTLQAVCKNLRKFEGTPSVRWFTATQFKQLVDALVRSIQMGEKDLTITQFIHQFRGLTSDEKVSSILKDFDHSAKYVSELAGQDKLIMRLCELMKKSSGDPNAEILGEIGKKNIYERIVQIYGDEPLRFKPEKIKGVTTASNLSIPYVLEVALAVMRKGSGRQIYTGINFSPCLKNPFEGYVVGWLDKKNNLQEARITTNHLEKYGIKDTEPVIVVIHLICPNIEYKSYGKGEINIAPFQAAIGQALTEVCRFYQGYKRRRGAKGRTSAARSLLRDELLRRQKILQKHGQIPGVERTTQQGIYYKIRSQMHGEIDIKRESFAEALKQLCIKVGGDLSFREKLGITAAERAQLYFRGQTHPISWDRIEQLATRGCDIILVEKEGVCEVLEPYASQRGIALLNSRGFATDYAQQLLTLSKKLKGNLFLLTDFDVSGLLIANKALKGEIPRLGVDLEMINQLGLQRNNLEERYDTKNGLAPTKHLKALPMRLQDEIREKRIEIDAVLAAVGPERLWRYLEEKMLMSAPKRDMNRSIDLTIRLPDEISEPLTRISEFVQSAGYPKQEEIKQKLQNWDKGFVNVEETEESLHSEIVEEIRKGKQVQELAKHLNEVVSKIPKTPRNCKQNKHG